MNTTEAFFPIIRAIFFKCSQKGRGGPPLLPANWASYTSPDIRMHPKTIVSTSHQNFNDNKNSCRELIVSILTCNKDNFTHVCLHKHNKVPQTILKNSKK